MKIKVGKSEVTAKSDGGISFYPKHSSSRNYPIFGIEVQGPPKLFGHVTNLHVIIYKSEITK